jgi:hypothetical protein
MDSEQRIDKHTDCELSGLASSDESSAEEVHTYDVDEEIQFCRRVHLDEGFDDNCDANRCDRRLEFTEAPRQANTSSQQSVRREVDSSHIATEDPEDILQRTVRNELDSSRDRIMVPKRSSAAKDRESETGRTSAPRRPDASTPWCDASAPHRPDVSAPWHDASASSREETSPISNKVQQDVGSVMPLSSLSPVQNDYAHPSSVHCFESCIGPVVDLSIVTTRKNFSNIRSEDELTKTVEHNRLKRNSGTKTWLHASETGDKLAKSNSRIVCSSSERIIASYAVRVHRLKSGKLNKDVIVLLKLHRMKIVNMLLLRKLVICLEIPSTSLFVRSRVAVTRMWATKVTGLVILVIEMNVGNRARLGFRLIVRSRVASMCTWATMVIDLDRWNAITTLSCGNQLGSHLVARSRVAILCTWATKEMGPDVG